MRSFPEGAIIIFKVANKTCNSVSILLVIVFKDVERPCRRTAAFSVIHPNLGRSTETGANGVLQPPTVNVLCLTSPNSTYWNQINATLIIWKSATGTGTNLHCSVSVKYRHYRRIMINIRFMLYVLGVLNNIV